MITRRRIAFMLVFALLLSLVPFNFAFAATKDIADSIQILEADPNSDLVLSEVSIVVHPDERISVKTEGTKKAGTPEIAYDISINLEKGTYTTELLTEKDTLDALVEESYGTSSIAPGIYSAQVRVVTRDPWPLQYELASTTNYLNWTVYSNGTVNWNGYGYNFWAANPSPANTHWYVTWSSESNPWYSGGNTQVNTACEAEYHNWDFPPGDLSTHAWHYVSIRGQNDAYFTYWAYWDHWGWASELLSGTVYVN